MKNKKCREVSIHLKSHSEKSSNSYKKTNEISFIKTINNLINQNVLIAVARKLRLNFYDFSIHLAYTEIKFQTTIETK